GDDRGSEHLDKLEFGGNHTDVVEAVYVQKLADRLDGKVGFACCHKGGGLRAAGHDLDVDPVRDAELRENFLREEDAAGARGNGDQLRAQQRLPEALDCADVGLAGACAHRDADGRGGEVGVGAGGN